MNKRTNKQENKEKSFVVNQKQAISSAVKIEALEMNDSAFSSCARRSDEEHVVKVDHGLNSSTSTDNLKTSGGAVIIDYYFIVIVIEMN